MHPEMLQVVDTAGNFDRDLEPDLPSSELTKLHRIMVLTRTFDRRMIALQRQGRISFYAPCIGEEAAHIGSAYALSPRDWIFPQYREPGALLVRGMPLQQLISSLLANQEDLGKGRSFANAWGDRRLNIVHSSAPVGTQIPLAVGAAMAAKIRGDDMVSLAYFGDGATSSGYFHAGMNFAAVFKAPTIFFCKNNQYAISLPARRQFASKNIAVKAEGYGMRGILVDGNDLLATYRVTRETVEAARRGEGPTLIEASTYRIEGHSTSDDPTKYREEKEVEAWKERHPITRFRLYLEKKGLWNGDQEKEVWAEAEAQTTEAIRHAELIPPPSIQSMFEDVYADIPKTLREQLEEALGAPQGRKGE